uniref:Large ribosomal subunit protein bL21m n=1 Tax=Dromaius novaehollandiae TaxID=8790 RepID=A0A8C4J837_DRONO
PLPMRRSPQHRRLAQQCFLLCLQLLLPSLLSVFCISSRYLFVTSAFYFIIYRLVAKTSLSSPPWPEVKLPDPVEEAKYHAEVVQKVNEMIATGQYGRLFAVVHFASKQWKVTSEDLIMMDNVLEAECGDRIRMEKVLLVGADDFTLIGRPLLG